MQMIRTNFAYASFVDSAEISIVLGFLDSYIRTHSSNAEYREYHFDIIWIISTIALSNAR